jgi:hypothetical protein
LLIVALLAGCDRIWKVQGFVIPDSTVTLECPHGKGARLPVSDTGRFGLTSVGAMGGDSSSVALACNVQVTDPAGSVTTYPVRDHCRERHREGCVRVVIEVAVDRLVDRVSSLGDEADVLWVLFQGHAAGYQLPKRTSSYARVRGLLEAAKRRGKHVTVLSRGDVILDVE